MTFKLALAGELTVERRITFAEELLARLRTLPGVRGTAADVVMPLDNVPRQTSMAVSFDLASRYGGRGTAIQYHVVSPGYFELLGIRLLAGRDFSRADGLNSQPVAIVNKAAVDAFWRGARPVGSRLAQLLLINRGQWVTPDVVGVVENVPFVDIQTAAEPTVFVPLSQDPPSDVAVFVRSQSPNMIITSDAIRTVITSLDSQVAPRDMMTLAGRIDRATARLRFGARVFGAFGALAAILAIVGVYALVSYTVAQQMKDFAIRSALGVAPGALITKVVTQAAMLATAGLAFGHLGVFLGTRILRSSIDGLANVDWSTIELTVLLLLGVTTAASYVAARPVHQVDPASLLRCE
jgi:hypothetical protein